MATPPYTPLIPLSSAKAGSSIRPGGRRVFRHSDHKLEWTRDEFENWCISQAGQWGMMSNIEESGGRSTPIPGGEIFLRQENP
jgi:hypothetical protein